LSAYGKFLSARFANEDNTAVEVQTEKMGSIMLHDATQVTTWIQLVQSKLDIEPFVEVPGQVEPKEIGGFDVLTDG
jgi:hypothetical protein